MNTRFPIYLALSVFVISILTVSIKLSERTMLLTGKISARQEESRLILQFSPPDIVSITFNSTRELAGADITLAYDKKQTYILPSTLSGASGYITTGGDLNPERNVFTFSAVSEVPLKSGIIASFRVSGKATGIDFVRSESRVFSTDMKPMEAEFKAL